MTAVSRGYAQLVGGQVHYRSAGRPESPPLVLLHQTPSHSAMYEALMTQLADRFYLVAPDTPGFGASDRLQGECSIEAFSACLLEFLGVLKIDRCGLFGHHTGAAIAVQMACDSPALFSAVALCGPTLLTDEQRLSLPDRASSFPEDSSGQHLQQMWQRISGKESGIPDAIVQREALSAIACGDYYQASYRAVCAQDYAAQLESLRCPVLAIAGDKDVLKGAVQPTLALLSDGHTAELPSGAGTYVCEQDAGEVANILTAFFTAQESTKE